MTGPALLERMARNNAWANARLLAAVAALPHGAWLAPRAGFFPSIRATLNHAHAVDRYYIDALTGGGLGRGVFDHSGFAALDRLREAQAASDAELVGLCALLTHDTLESPVPTDRGGARTVLERRADVLLHLFQHQIHHRGQVHNMLSQAGAHPPQLDEFLLVYDRHPLAAAYGA